MEQNNQILSKILLHISIGKLSHSRPSKLNNSLTRRDIFVTLNAAVRDISYEPNMQKTNVKKLVAKVPEKYGKMAKNQSALASK